MWIKNGSELKYQISHKNHDHKWTRMTKTKVTIFELFSNNFWGKFEIAIAWICEVKYKLCDLKKIEKYLGLNFVTCLLISSLKYNVLSFLWMII